MFFLWIMCGILLTVVVLLSVKIVMLKKSIDEICEELKNHLSNDTNTLISISTGDKNMKHFAAELNQQLRLLRKQRQQYLNGGRELKETVTNISHDLRTPLTAISGYLELLEEETKSVTTQRYLDIINNRVELLKELIEELFQYSVITVSKDKIVTEKIILNELLEESIASFYTALKKRSIVPIVHMPQIKVKRDLSPSILSRVLSNLLNNAVKYSDGDLEITLSETGEIAFVNTAAKLNTVKVGKLFDQFYTVNTAENSTGLGLGITRSLINQMNGTISAVYQRNKLIIRIQLPDDNSSN